MKKKIILRVAFMVEEHEIVNDSAFDTLRAIATKHGTHGFVPVHLNTQVEAQFAKSINS